MNDKTLIRDIAVLLGEVYHFARYRAGRLFLYKDGVYTPRAEFFLRQQVKRLLLLFDKAERWSSSLGRELIEFILLDTPELDPRPADNLINVENGLLDIWTGQLLPHSPRILSSVQIPVDGKRQWMYSGIELRQPSLSSAAPEADMAVQDLASLRRPR
jgi:hypothetical protein